VTHSAAGGRVHREVMSEEGAEGAAMSREARMELGAGLDSDSFCKVSFPGSRGVPWPNGDRGRKAGGAANLGSKNHILWSDE
jgi:hypothetical protein